MRTSLHAWFSIALLLFSVASASGQTQSSLNQGRCAQYEQADQELNATYSKVRHDYAKQPEFLSKLKQAQRAWIVFRDAHLAARFPAANKQTEYGSAYPMCRCALLTEVTEQRIRELKVWADGIPEGDMCNGSVKTAGSGPGDSKGNRVRRFFPECS